MVEPLAAIQAAAELLRSARSPLVCGLSHLGIADQQALVQFARHLAAAIDLDWQPAAEGFLNALQVTGRVTATLGQVAEYSGHLLLIEAAPEQTHPRLLQRLKWGARPGWRLRTKGLETGDLSAAGGPAIRDVVCADERELNQLLWWVRAGFQGLGDAAEQCPPRWRELITELVTAARESRGLTIFAGAQLDQASQLALQVHQLARQANELCKAWLLLLSENGNAAGAESVLAWSTGFPRGVDLRRGTPAWNRDELTAARLLRSGECDCLIVSLPADGTAAWEQLSADFRDRLMALPKIVFYSGDHPLLASADVALPITQVGWDKSGDVVRLDELTLTAKAVLANAQNKEAASGAGPAALRNKRWDLSTLLVHLQEQLK